MDRLGTLGEERVDGRSRHEWTALRQLQQERVDGRSRHEWTVVTTTGGCTTPAALTFTFHLIFALARVVSLLTLPPLR